MRVHGTGVVGPTGRGPERLAGALEAGWREPAAFVATGTGAGTIAARTVRDETFADKGLLRGCRRADRFTRMCVVAAADAVADAGLDLAGSMRVGVILATALGPHATTFRFLDEIIEFGEGCASAMVFSHSVHNAAVSYIGSALQVRGPSVTVSQFHFSFHQALLAAQAWLREGRCDYVLAGAADEVATVMAYASLCLLPMAPDGRLQPFAGAEKPVATPAEGAVFFLLSLEEDKPARACFRLEEVRPDGVRDVPDLHLLEADGLSGDEAGYIVAARDLGVPVASYSTVFGSMFSTSAFHAAAAVQVLQRGRAFPNPEAENPHRLSLAGPALDGIRRIRSTRLDCTGRQSHLWIVQAPEPRRTDRRGGGGR